SITDVIGPTGAVVGVDAAPAMIEVARRKAERMRLTNATFQVASADNLPFEAQTFDSVICGLARCFSRLQSTVFVSLYEFSSRRQGWHWRCGLFWNAIPFSTSFQMSSGNISRCATTTHCARFGFLNEGSFWRC